MACCKGDEYGNWCDGVDIVWTDPETEDEYCLFHAPAEHKKIDEIEFNYTLNNRIALRHFSKTIDLRGLIANGPIQLYDLSTTTVLLDDSQFDASLNITKCKFNRLHLNNVHVKTDIQISDIQIREELQMSGCTAANIDILFSRIPSQLLFSNVKCSTATLEFMNLPTEINLHFLQCNSIHAVCSTPETRQKKIKYFSIQSSTLDAILSVTNFRFDPCFLHNLSTCNTTFIQCYFSQLIYNSKSLLNSTTFIGCALSKLFINPDALYYVHFFACTFPKARNGRYVISHSLSKSECENILHYHKIEELTPSALEELYRQLKKRAQQNENRIEASDWHYWEKHFAQKRLRLERDWGKFSITWLYHMLSGYGESVQRGATFLTVFLSSSALLGLFKFCGIYFSEPSHIQLVELTRPNGLGLFSSSGYLALKFVWTDFEWYKALQTTFDFIPLATKAPDTASVSLWRPLELFWQALITFQATLLGFALRNRYRR